MRTGVPRHADILTQATYKQDINVPQLQEEVYVVTKGKLLHYPKKYTEKTVTVLHPFLSPLGGCQWMM